MLTTLSDLELITNFQDLIVEEREKLANQLEYIAELDRRKLFFHYSSLRSYLIEEHGLDEWNAERKIRAARLMRKFPEIKGMIESGKLNLSLIEIGQSCAYREELSPQGLFEILKDISGLSCRAAKRELAYRYPASMDIYQDKITPLTGDLFEVKFAANEELLNKLEEIKGLLAHSHPRIKMAELIDVLATEYRERHHPEEKAKRAEERAEKKKLNELVDSRSAPRVQNDDLKRVASQSIIHELTNTMGYRCAYQDPMTGKSCNSQHGLEIDHIKVWSEGGKTEVSNLRYLCSAHHSRVSFLKFGEKEKYIKRTH